MLRVEQVGGLAVAWNPSDKKTVERELQKLSSTLFLDPELDPATGVYWTVKDAVSLPPVCVLVWREDDGSAKPLTLAIVEQVKRQEGALAGAVDEMIRRDKARREKLQAEALERNEEIYREHEARIKSARGDTLPPFWRPKRFGAK